jgi:hypothetical protein
MQFTSITDPKDFVLKTKLNEAEALANDSINTPVPDSNKPETDTKEKPLIINQYDPNAKKNIRMNEATKKLIWEYMDMTDIPTVNTVCAMNEAEHNTMLVSLTNKLYEMIVDKVDSIDFGEIPQTKGDISKLSKFEQLNECHRVLREIFEQYHENTKPILELENAVTNIESMKDIFIGAYLCKANFPITVYQTMTLAVLNATSFMIASCIEYIKNPKAEGLTIVLNKTGVAKAKDHLVYETLVDFNEACRKGDVQNALKPFVQHKIRGFAMTAALGIKAVLVIGAVVLAILPMIKDLVYFYYSARARVSQYFDIQAKLLEMNAQELKDNPDIQTVDDRKSVISRQLSIARNFHDLANFIGVDAKTSEVKATKEIKSDSRKYKIDDVETNPATDGPLF